MFKNAPPTRSVLLAIIISILLSGHGAAELPGQLVALQKQHGEQLAKATEERSAFIDHLNSNYLVSLERYEAGRLKVSDLEAVFAARDEKGRFEKHETVEAADVVAEPASLRVLQERYIRSVSRHAGEFARREVTTHRQYLSMLEPLQREFTKPTRLNEAVLIRDEIARVRSLIPRDPTNGRSVTLPSSLRGGLELHLGFDRLPGPDRRIATTIFDRSGKRHHASLEGEARWIADGKVGGAIRLSGGSDRVISAVDTTRQGTVGVWIRPRKSLDATTPRFGIVRADGGSEFLVVDGDTGAIEFSITSTQDERSTCSTETKTWAAGTW